MTIVGGNADEPGEKAYIERIESGRIRKEDLPLMLMESEEFNMLRRSGDLANELVKR